MQRKNCNLKIKRLQYKQSTSYRGNTQEPTAGYPSAANGLNIDNTPTDNFNVMITST